ncbi:hypothetical protein L249_7556 [Ophiocordyceps polyrhachis-furcata BCC 54312]|uniref:N-acetyltransferase domain-containing protein n=1 Tax=Ophiocordyceps polyrhachis-furcata BCC 54312 TaxID=1330021 RepID=A0A367LC82_9HYPO|nr:hypothetical protein L249_7556 [Ophiocordyceps polyrhachis-furcata BCC 54312]
MEDPGGSTIFHVSGQPSFPPSPSGQSGLPPDLGPRHVTLRDRQTAATIVPLWSRQQVPDSLLAYLCDQLNREIEGGDTYPMTESHVCTGSFIVTDGSRNRGVGRLMGEAYLEWAPRLGYRYSVFNLVYETNVASCRIWDSLGFKRIGRVKSCGSLRSYPDRLIDGVIYGRDLPVDGAGGGTDDVGEERFDKIRFYLKYGRYPNGAGRAEKSRLRSAATHYKLLEGDRLMLRDKEVVAEPARQYEVARRVHALHHGGINKTTASIAERYHWSRIKETVSDVIRACAECKDPPTKQSTSQRNHHHHHNLHSIPSSSSAAASPPVLDRLQQLDGLHAHNHHLHHNLYHQPIDPQIVNDPHRHNNPADEEDPFAHYPPHPDFQTLLEDDDDDDDNDDDKDAVNRDLDMLIEHDPVQD